MTDETLLVSASLESLQLARRDVDASERARAVGHLDVSARLAAYAADRAEEAAALLRARASALPAESFPRRLVPASTTGGGIEWVMNDDDVSYRIDDIQVAA